MKNKQTINTFKQQIDVWQQQPELLCYEEIPPREDEQSKKWTSSVHNLFTQSQLMHITPDATDPSKIAFSFYQNAPPFGELNIGRVKHPQGNFECAMLVNDLRDQG